MISTFQIGIDLGEDSVDRVLELPGPGTHPYFSMIKEEQQCTAKLAPYVVNMAPNLVTLENGQYYVRATDC